MKKIILIIYTAIGLYGGIGAWFEHKDEEEMDLWSWIGITLGAVFWPISVILYLIWNHEEELND